MIPDYIERNECFEGSEVNVTKNVSVTDTSDVDENVADTSDVDKNDADASDVEKKLTETSNADENVADTSEVVDESVAKKNDVDENESNLEDLNEVSLIFLIIYFLFRASYPPPWAPWSFGVYYNEDCSSKTVLVLDSLSQGRCLQQIAPSCLNKLKLFAPTLSIILLRQRNKEKLDAFFLINVSAWEPNKIK